MAQSTGQESKTLSIRLHANGFCFIRQQKEGPIKWGCMAANSAQSPLGNLNAFVKKFHLADEEYAQVNLLSVTRHYTPLPQELHTPGQEQAILRHLLPHGTDERQPLCHPAQECGITLLYGLNRYWHDRLGRLFPGARHLLHAGLLLSEVTRQPHPRQSMNLNLRPGEADLIAIDDSKPVYINSFACTAPADAQFYLLSVWKMLQFSREYTPLFITGDPRMRSELMQSTRPFVRHIELPDAPALPGATEADEEKIPYELKLIPCEL